MCLPPTALYFKQFMCACVAFFIVLPHLKEQLMYNISLHNIVYARVNFKF